MNKEHYRLEALKLAIGLNNIKTTEYAIRDAEVFLKWIMQDAIEEEQAKQEDANQPDYKVPPLPFR